MFYMSVRILWGLHCQDGGLEKGERLRVAHGAHGARAPHNVVVGPVSCNLMPSRARCIASDCHDDGSTAAEVSAVMFIAGWGEVRDGRVGTVRPTAAGG